MAVIGKIRSYSWLILVFVGVALLAFILGDFMKKGPSGPDTTIGEIAGEKINYMEFDNQYKEQLELYKKQSGQAAVDKNTSFQIMQELWNQKVKETIIHKEATELGLAMEQEGGNEPCISAEELKDLILGKNPHQFVIQFFAKGDPSQFNPAQVAQFIQNLDKVDPFYRTLWLYYERMIREERLVTKYNNLIAKGLYVTKAEAKKNQESRNKLADFRFVSLKYASIADDAVKVSDDEKKKYYEEHKFEYEQEASRGIEYVMFEVKPSPEDLKIVREESAKVKAEFAAATDVEAFVNANSDISYDKTFHKKGELDMSIDTVLFKSPVGTIVGPFETETTIKIAKLMDRQSRPDSLKAAHVLIAFKGAARAQETTKLTKEQAKAKADSIKMACSKDTAKLAEIASKMSDDPSAKENKGSLGWFTDGQMVKPFNDACAFGKVGEVVVVETDFGYHVIRILGKTAPKDKIQVAVVERKVVPSEATFDAMYNQANTFSTAVTANPASFENKITEMKQNKRVAEYVREIDRQLPGMENPVEMVRWIYKSNKGDVSSVFDVGEKYVVAKVAEIREKGFATMEQVKKEVEAGAKRDKKGQMLADKMKASMTGATSVDQIAAKLQTKVDTAVGLSYSAYGVPNLGAEPVVIGTVFGLQKGKMSKPIIGKSGVAVVVVDNFHTTPSAEDIKQTRSYMQGYMKQRVSSEAFNALQKKADVQDNRGKFY